MYNKKSHVAVFIAGISLLFVALASTSVGAEQVGELQIDKTDVVIQFNQMIHESDLSQDELRQEVSTILTGAKSSAGYDLIDFYESELNWDEGVETVGQNDRDPDSV